MDVTKYVEKEVYFNEYCGRCVHSEVKQDEEPCNECLAAPSNLYSHKPVKYEENERLSRQSST